MPRLPTLFLALVLAPIGGRAQQSSPQSALNEPVQEVDLKAGMHPPKLIEHVEAAFPDDARLRNIDGKCKVSLIVNLQGDPQDTHIVRCTDSSFAQTSLRAVSRYKFKPATTANGTPIPVHMSVDISYQLAVGEAFRYPVLFGFFTPPGTSTTAPDAAGIYPLTQQVTPPTMSKFLDQGWGDHAFDAGSGSLCKVVLTIGADGKASNGVVSFCQTDSLAELAMKSLLASRYKPATLNGKPVAVRTMVHLEYGELPAKP